MTTIYNPTDPDYFDEADVRDEMTRVFDICHSCQLCTALCTTFPTLFEMIDRHDDHDAGRLTPAQQDTVADQCFQCKLCHVKCPYKPELHERAVDFPRLILRAGAMRHETHQTSIRNRATDFVMGHTDLAGKVATRTARVSNRIVAARPRSIMRKVVEKTTGVSSVRLLRPFVKQRFTTWFKQRPKVRINKRQGRVAVFPTCIVEYRNPAIGQDLVKVYERNGIECTVAGDIGCCGAPWLLNGDVEHFTKVATANVKQMADIVRKGLEIVVPEPTCGYVIKKDYPDYVGGAEAELVAAHTFDACDYLMKVHKADTTALDTNFTGDVPDTITYHTPCHLKAQGVGLKSRDLLKLTGAKVTLVQQCSGVGGTWGLRKEHAALSISIGKQLGEQILRAGGDVVAGDCTTANTAITELTGEQPWHPLQIVARAYGIPEEEQTGR